MKIDRQWKVFWEQTAGNSASDFEYDHGRSPRQKAIEDCSNRELISFINPSSSEVVFDAGCGTGANIVLLHSKVGRVIGMDYNQGAVERCRKKIVENNIKNVELLQGGITEIPMKDSSVDKIMCMSVLQYLDDVEVRMAFKEFLRVLTNEGTVILHVKNLSSVYLSTLCLMKRAKSLFGRAIKMEHYRPFQWYVVELANLGFEILDYNSFNWFIIEGMPNWLRSALQKFEFEHFADPIFRSGFVRRHGADLKIKARICKDTKVNSHH